MKISPTTTLAWVRLVFCVLLLGHIIFKVFADGAHAVDASMAAAYFAVYLLGDRIMGTVESHFTADSPPEKKADDAPVTMEEMAACLYGAYCENVGGVAFNGDRLPSWSEFVADAAKQKQADAWRKTAYHALQILGKS